MARRGDPVQRVTLHKCFVRPADESGPRRRPARLNRTLLRLIRLGGFLVAAPAPAQTLPHLEPVPVAAPLAELEFSVAAWPLLVVHSSGCLAMFDEDVAQVACVDPVSGVTRRFGRSGSGPGEFIAVNAMIGATDGGLLVFDVIKNVRFTVLTPDWKLDRVVRATQQFSDLFRPTKDSVLTIGGARRRDLVAVSLRDGGMATHFSPTAADSALFIGPNELDFFGFWLVPLHRGGWYVASPYHYTVLAENERGEVQSRFGREIGRELPTEREVVAARRVMEKGNPGRNLDGFMQRFRKTPKLVIQGAPVEDGQDRLWVVTGRMRQDSTELDVFDPHGRYLGTRRIPGELHALTVHGADLYALVEYIAGPREGGQGVLQYRIR